MKWYEYFRDVFGHITLSEAFTFVFAALFLLLIYKEIRKYVNVKVEEHKKNEQVKREQLAKLEASYEMTQKCPAYRQENIQIHATLEREIKEIRDRFGTIMNRLDEIEEQNRKRECSKLKDMLLQNYRYYTNEVQNPSKSWTKMESEAFWELFREYEEAGGDGYMHTVVQPEMARLTVVGNGLQK